MLQKKQLGQTGMEVTQLGYGAMGIRGPNTWGVRTVDEAQAESILNAVVDAGINFIDTAPVYGISEARIGRYLGHRRDDFFLATKCGRGYTQHADHIEIADSWTKTTVERDIETSLKRLQTDHVDLLQFHGGDAETLQANGLIDLLVDFRDQGLTKHIGVSTKAPFIEDLVKLDVFETFQIEYSCLKPANDAWITKAAESGAGMIIRGGIAHGGPDAEIERPALNDVWEQAGLEELLEAGMSKAAMILRYTLSHPGCHTTIVGTCSHDHLAENLEAATQGPLPAELVQQVKTRVGSVL